MKNMLAILEAILFASGETISTNKIIEASGLTKKQVLDNMELLKKRYDESNSALQILKLEDNWQLCTRKEYSPYIINAINSKKSSPLSPASMEVLTIVAYNQPVTKTFISNVRGIDSSSTVNNLVERDLLEEAGRLDVPGHPIAYQTTNNFLKCFGLCSLSELPSIPIELKEKEDTTKK